ncbi:hypothetical protein Desor_3395 [Desulfosporosinus orientis DSM 765]|uniref:Flagellar hook-length control protein FliK n=1 Tax=Desulfosporosinus orientis (strain ATCC 19365 / DSM 765 / NCIMB 8382 / VKM B-1628 / Singapore I) TaxID=768706 RepID=G7WFL7_DESOD|nr:hypothetical protein [Desulfosporosinus orientis]AET68890.1 hypothetical protein Desor_3395 [Desulfosporosinus orientis DSM 765]
MDINGIYVPSSLNQNQINKFRLGERMLVEVVNKVNEREGVVRFRGQTIAALLETTTQVGEKFWAKVGGFSEGRLLLIREPSLGKSEEAASPSQYLQLTERGLPKNPELLALIKTFTATKMEVFNSLFSNITGTTISDELIVNLIKLLPEWNSLSEENGAEELLSSLRKFGFDYEHRLLQMLKIDTQNKEIEKQSLKDTIKGMLLKAMEGHKEKGSSDNNPISQLLEKITGQQLWLKTGVMDNAYMMLHFPLLDQGEFVPVQIAMESARKGLKMDDQHCRIAIMLETQELGKIGVDAYFNEDSITCRVLSYDLDFLPQLLEVVIPETRVRFAKLGFNLGRIDIGDLDENHEFIHFLEGSRRSGVDILR